MAFAAPMLHELKRNPDCHALVIYPMKSLAFDQRIQIQRLCEPLGIASWFLDGDVEKEHKKILKANRVRLFFVGGSGAVHGGASATSMARAT